MAANTQSRRNGPVLRSISPSPCGRFPTSRNHSYSPSSSSAFASSSSSSFYSSPSTFFHTSHHHRSASPTRVNLYSSSSSASPTFSISRSPSRSISVAKQSNNNHPISLPTKQTCLCSPTSHPGSFRCSLHKNSHSHSSSHHGHSSSSPTPVRLNMRRSAMTNSLVRIGGVEGELVKRALSALIRPSSHHQKRRSDFQRRPSRLSNMTKSGDE